MNITKNYFLFSCLLFIVSASLGFIFHEIFKESLLQFIKELYARAENYRGISLIGYILFNNLAVAISCLVFGLFFGLFPIFIASFNGYILGFISRIVMDETRAINLLGLIPHGIFELPALIISLGLGIKMGFSIFEKERSFKKDIIECLRVFFLLAIPLFVIAAFIEGLLISYLI
jgi:stage II sporulation protein M